MDKVCLEVWDVNKDIVEVNKYEFVEVISEVIFHERHEDIECIGEYEWKDEELKQTVTCPEGCQMYRLFV